MYEFGAKSKNRMAGVDARLIHVAEVAIKISSHRGGVDFTIPTFGGLRSEREQQWLVDNGRSKTMNSYHRKGKALDVIPYLGNWRKSVYGLPKEHQSRLFHEVAVCMLEAASQLRIQLAWGGNWRGQWDKPHYQIKD